MVAVPGSQGSQGLRLGLPAGLRTVRSDLSAVAWGAPAALASRYFPQRQLLPGFVQEAALI